MAGGLTVILTKTLIQFTTAVEEGTVTDILAALKKPGADRVIMVVTMNQGGREVWDVG